MGVALGIRLGAPKLDREMMVWHCLGPTCNKRMVISLFRENLSGIMLWLVGTPLVIYWLIVAVVVHVLQL